MLSTKGLFTFCFLNGLVFLFATDGKRRPGVRSLFTTKGLNYVRSIAIPVIEGRLNKLEIPAVSGKIDLFVGNLSYDFKNITLSRVRIPKSHVSVRSNTGLFVQGAQITFEVNELWNYKFTSWPFISDSGSSVVSGKGISLNVLVEVDKDKKGGPLVRASHCNLHIGDFSITFRGAVSWLYNLFIEVVKDQLRVNLEKGICNVAIKTINKRVNAELKTIPDKTTVSDFALKINNDLTRRPTVNYLGIETSVKGEFVNIEKPVHAPYVPDVLPSINGQYPKMLYVWITAYTVNTVLYAVHQTAPSSTVFTLDDLPDNIPVKFNTDAFMFIVPPLYEKYPGKDIALSLRRTQAPRTTFNPDHGYITFYGTITFNVVLQEKHLVDCFTLESVAKLRLDSVFVYQKENSSYVGGKVSTIQNDISLKESNIGQFSMGALQFVVDVFSQFIVSGYLAGPINRGFRLSIPPTVTLVNTETKMQENHLLVTTDMTLQMKPE